VLRRARMRKSAPVDANGFLRLRIFIHFAAEIGALKGRIGGFVSAIPRFESARPSQRMTFALLSLFLVLLLFHIFILNAVQQPRRSTEA
jgi:hypothetical protein